MRIGCIAEDFVVMGAEKKRVAHLTTVHNVQDPRIFRKELGTLRDADYEVYLIAPSERSEVIDGIRVTALPQVSGRYRRIRIHGEVYRAARALKADLYHFHDPELIPVAYTLKRATGARVIYDMHEDYRWHGPIEGRLLRALERWCFTWVDHVIVANAEHVEITEQSRVPTTRIANYFKPSKNHPVPTRVDQLPSDGPLRLIYTGVMSDQGGRGLSSLIHLAEIIKRRHLNWKLDLVGVCYVEADRRRADNYIRRKGLGTVIRQIGWDRYVIWEDMLLYLQQAHVGVVLGTDHPNQTQKIPTKFYEYLNFGLPILCSDFPCWRRFIRKHACGAMVPADDVEAAANVVEEWTNRPDYYHALANAARAAASLYRWEKVARRLVQLYDRLLV